MITDSQSIRLYQVAQTRYWLEMSDFRHAEDRAYHQLHLENPGGLPVGESMAHFKRLLTQHTTGRDVTRWGLKPTQDTARPAYAYENPA